MKQNEYVNGLSLKVRNISVVLKLQRSLHIFYLLKENKDQRKEILPSKEKFKLVTDNRRQWKRNKTYADVVVNITVNLELRYKTESDNGTTPNRNKKDSRSTVQKPMMSKQRLKSVCNLILSEDSLNAKTYAFSFNCGHCNF